MPKGGATLINKCSPSTLLIIWSTFVSLVPVYTLAYSFSPSYERALRGWCENANPPPPPGGPGYL
jgi:hypothetical protein